MSCSNSEGTSAEAHEHTWVPDGETFTETNHHPSCEVEEAEGMDKLDAIRRCECDTHRFRRYTCHCGEMKEVKYNG